MPGTEILFDVDGTAVIVVNVIVVVGDALAFMFSTMTNEDIVV